MMNAVRVHISVQNTQIHVFVKAYASAGRQTVKNKGRKSYLNNVFLVIKTRRDTESRLRLWGFDRGQW